MFELCKLIYIYIKLHIGCGCWIFVGDFQRTNNATIVRKKKKLLFLFFHCSICRRNIYSIDNQWWLFQFNLSVIYRTLSVTGHAYSYNDSRNSVCVMEA